MAALTTAQVLCSESEAIHGGRPAPADAELYGQLNALNSTALCLSGGGIRSAAFALGVIQAFAAYPRSNAAAATVDERAGKSLLAQFHYLSTVSGGGYIGSWLSAWRHNQPFATIWQRLVSRPQGPGDEPGEISWLRAYSNYLTPQIGFGSANTWAAVGMSVRNVVLNWLIVLSPLCAIVLLMKIFGLSSIWIILWDKARGWYPTGHITTDGLDFYLKVVLEILSGFVGAGCLVRSLALMTRGRPSRRPPGDQGINQAQFLWGVMAWSLLSAILLVHWLASDLAGNLLLRCAEPIFEFNGRILAFDPPNSLFQLLGLCAQNVLVHPLNSEMNIARHNILYYLTAGAAIGALLYLMGWNCGRPAQRSTRDRSIWTVSGAVYGGFVALAFYVYLVTPDQVTFNVDSKTVVVGVYFFHLAFLIPWILLSQVLALAIFVGLASREPDSGADREWLGRASGWILCFGVIWLITFFLVFFGVLAAPFVGKDVISRIERATSAVTLISGIITAVFGTSKLLPAVGGPADLTSYLMSLLLPVTAILFGAALVIFTSAALDWTLFGNPVRNLKPDDLIALPWQPQFLRLFAALVAAVAVAYFASMFININRFSLHALHRNRLVRTFLGAVRTRHSDLFTGFDAADSPKMHELFPPRRASLWRPFHVINMTLNVASSRRLAWQERKTEPFTVSPLHCGGDYAGYRDSAIYGGRTGISLGTAMAISGAAASPNTGYHASPAVTFLMTMFNVRLGWWLGNPGAAGELTFRDEGPRFAVWALVAEAIGLTTDTRRYVYLSDGGHFENLGLYEMIRRRCRFVVISDVGCDPDYKFFDLANAVRRIEIDLGVTISFENLDKLKPRPKDGGIVGPGQPYHAIGEIDYRAADGAGENGIILYIKAGYHGFESAGIRGYALLNPDFPHQLTIDQWFTESQFESYRALGFEITDGILKRALQDPDCAANPTLANVLVALRNETPQTPAAA